MALAWVHPSTARAYGTAPLAAPPLALPAASAQPHTCLKGALPAVFGGTCGLLAAAAVSVLGGQLPAASGRKSGSGVALRATREGDVGENGGEAFFPTSELEAVEATGEQVPTEPAMRIGHGYDIHKMLPRDDLEAWGKVSPQPAVIGGITFEDFDLGVVAHSDGDVIYHSTTDAILGALGLPDIGQLFPDNDPRWRGANSEQFFDEAVRLMEMRGYRVGNVDVTIIAEKPRLAARKPAMKENIVRICHTVPARVNIKARTHEKLDSVGECRALECHVCILLERC